MRCGDQNFSAPPSSLSGSSPGLEVPSQFTYRLVQSIRPWFRAHIPPSKLPSGLAPTDPRRPTLLSLLPADNRAGGISAQSLHASGALKAAVVTGKIRARGTYDPRTEASSSRYPNLTSCPYLFCPPHVCLPHCLVALPPSGPLSHTQSAHRIFHDAAQTHGTAQTFAGPAQGIAIHCIFIQ